MSKGNFSTHLTDAIIAQNTLTSGETAEARLNAIDERLKENHLTAEELLYVKLQKARLLIEVERKEQAWELAKMVFDARMKAHDFEGAVDACDVLFLAQQEASLAALGMGVWLGVTFPIDPNLSISMLQHIVDETPDDADGAAVAAATACYIADLRAAKQQREELMFFTNQMLGSVARRHSKIDDQQQFDRWIDTMELNEPAKFLIRLRNIVDVLVQEDWWFDREQLQAMIPDN